MLRICRALSGEKETEHRNHNEFYLPRMIPTSLQDHDRDLPPVQKFEYLRSFQQHAADIKGCYLTGSSPMFFIPTAMSRLS